ncbi:hypothetical protein IBD95_05060 [Francisella tularensis]|nr:hypothetical protein [Francisella tularensis]
MFDSSTSVKDLRTLIRYLSEMALPLISFNISTVSSAMYIVCSCLLYTSPSPRDISGSRMPSSA